MKWTTFCAALLALVAWVDVPQTFAGDVSDVVRARANARAGGSTGGHDAYILKKHGGALSGTAAKKKAAAKRKAAARKRAAAKRRAAAAKKKQAAQRRAAIAAKKKAEAKRRAAIAAKRKRANAADSGDGNSNGGTVTAPSTAAVLTNQDINGEEPEKTKAEKTEDVAVATDQDSTEVTGTDTKPAADSNVGNTAKDGDEKCKRFIPEVGQTVTVDC